MDAPVVASAGSGGTVLTGDQGDIAALAGHARNVAIELVRASGMSAYGLPRFSG